LTQDLGLITRGGHSWDEVGDSDAEKGTEKLMNVRLLHTTVGLAFAGLIAMTGCSKDEDDTDGMTGDAGQKDMTVADTGDDSGVPDMGPRDNGVPDMGVDPCLNGTEGCECTSTLMMNDTMFKQDDCETGLLCIPWDIVAGRQMDVTGPVHSCVKPCTNDSDCGANRFCNNNGFFNAESGAASYCVDRVAEVDEFCGGSRPCHRRSAS
jgi:hypothetical protein